MFAAFKTFFSSIVARRLAGQEYPGQRLAAQDSESRLRSLREEELFFWQPTPLSWF